VSGDYFAGKGAGQNGASGLEGRMKGVAALIVGLALTLSAGVAFGQDETVSYKKRTVIDFTDVTIEGELTKPEGSYIVNRKFSKFSSLIKLRENYVFELLSSASDI
jgi:hypothetical protein